MQIAYWGQIDHVMISSNRPCPHVAQYQERVSKETQRSPSKSSLLVVISFETLSWYCATCGQGLFEDIITRPSRPEEAICIFVLIIDAEHYLKELGNAARVPLDYLSISTPDFPFGFCFHTQSFYSS